MKRVTLALLATIIFFAFGDFGIYTIKPPEKKYISRIFPTTMYFSKMFQPKKAFADVVSFPTVGGGSTATASEISALESTLVREGYTIGSNAVKADFDAFASQTWQRLTLVQRSAIDTAISNSVAVDVAEGVGMSALSEFIIPAAIAVGIFGVGYYLYNNLDIALPWEQQTAINASYPMTTTQNIAGLYFTNYANVYTNWVVGGAGAINFHWKSPLSQVESDSPWGATMQYEKTYLYKSSGYIYVRIYALVNGVEKFHEWLAYDDQQSNDAVNTTTGTQETTSTKSVPSGTVGQDTSYYDNSYQQTSGKDLTVRGPDPKTGTITDSDFNTMKSSPTVTVSPTQSAEPTPTGTQDTSWWKWLMAPLNAILQLLHSIWDWMKGIWNTMTEWATSIISKLADLLGSWGTWFADLYTHLGNWFQTLWDTLGNLLTSLGNWLQPLGDWFASVVSAVQALPGQLADFFTNLGNDIVGLPDAIGNWFMDNIVGDPNNVQWDKLKQSGEFFTTKFPFSLPWDVDRGLHAVFGGFNASDPPKWDFKITDSYTVTIQMPDLIVGWSPFIRAVMLIMFDLGIAYAVSRLLGGAK